jgi:predicted small lipoprotein YifL
MLALLMLLGMLAACGHYGPPVRAGHENDGASSGAQTGSPKAPKDRDRDQR